VPESVQPGRFACVWRVRGPGLASKDPSPAPSSSRRGSVTAGARRPGPPGWERRPRPGCGSGGWCRCVCIHPPGRCLTR